MMSTVFCSPPASGPLGISPELSTTPVHATRQATRMASAERTRRVVARVAPSYMRDITRAAAVVATALATVTPLHELELDCSNLRR
jgi:hypothetical protein